MQRLKELLGLNIKSALHSSEKASSLDNAPLINNQDDKNSTQAENKLDHSLFSLEQQKGEYITPPANLYSLYYMQGHSDNKINSNENKKRKPRIVNFALMLNQDLVEARLNHSLIAQNYEARLDLIKEAINKLVEDTFDDKAKENFKKYTVRITPGSPIEIPSAQIDKDGKGYINIPLWMVMDFDLDNLAKNYKEFGKFLRSSCINLEYNKPFESQQQILIEEYFSFNMLKNFVLKPRQEQLIALKNILLHELGHIYYKHMEETFIQIVNFSNIYRSICGLDKNKISKGLAIAVNCYLLLPCFLYRNYQKEKEADEFIANYGDANLAKGFSTIFESIGETLPQSSHEKCYQSIFKFGMLFSHGSGNNRSKRIEKAHTKMADEFEKQFRNSNWL